MASVWKVTYTPVTMTQGYGAKGVSEYVITTLDHASYEDVCEQLKAGVIGQYKENSFRHGNANDPRSLGYVGAEIHELQFVSLARELGKGPQQWHQFNG